jgi:type 1 glutamine amidotransferase
VKALAAQRVHLVVFGRYHDMDFARLELLKLIAEIPWVRTSTASNYSDLESLAAADLLITYTCDVAPDALQTAALKAFLEHGGRWIALHGTNALLDFVGNGAIGVARRHDDFMDLIGTRFLAHPPIGPFQVEVTDAKHPLTMGLERFEIIDELYLFERRGPIRTLLHAPFTGNCSPFVAAVWEDERSPVLYLHEVGAGTVLYLSLGHCRGHYDPSPNGAYIVHPLRCAWNYPIYYELLRRGLQWGLESHELRRTPLKQCTEK